MQRFVMRIQSLIWSDVTDDIWKSAKPDRFYLHQKDKCHVKEKSLFACGGCVKITSSRQENAFFYVLNFDYEKEVGKKMWGW